MIRSESELQESNTTLILSERDVQSLFEGMTEAEVVAGATDWIERAFIEQAGGDLRLHRRVHVDYPEGRGYEDGSVIRILPCILPGLGVAAFRAYPDHHGGRVLDPSRKAEDIDYRMGSELLVVYDYDNGMKLVAIMSHYLLMNARTAAPTALSVRHLARENSRVFGFFGAGRHASAQIKSVLNERPGIEEVRLCGRTPARRDALAERLAGEGEVSQKIVPVDRPEDAVKGCDIVVTCTNAGKPVFDGEWIEPGTHVTQVARGEIDATTVRRSRVFAVWKDQILHDIPPMQPFGDMVASGELKDEDVSELSDVIAGKNPGRRSGDEITLCPTQGMGLWDAAVGKWAYGLAVEKGVGQPFVFRNDLTSGPGESV